MKLKAILICEDVRFEIGGTVTLVGVFNERLVVGPGNGPITLPQLSCIAVIGGLRGVERLAYRHWIRIGDGERPELSYEAHDPDLDEHNFVSSQVPMLFPDAGTYEVVLDIEAGTRRATYRYSFHVERREA